MGHSWVIETKNGSRKGIALYHTVGSLYHTVGYQLREARKELPVLGELLEPVPEGDGPVLEHLRRDAREWRAQMRNGSGPARVLVAGGLLYERCGERIGLRIRWGAPKDLLEEEGSGRRT